MDTASRGRIAEGIAAEHLRSLGYVIVERNYRCPVGELDLVARDGDDLVFVEVRSRTDAEHGGAALAVGPVKQRRVARVAEYYLADRAPACTTCRFDVVAITAGTIELYRDAFRLGL